MSIREKEELLRQAADKWTEAAEEHKKAVEHLKAAEALRNAPVLSKRPKGCGRAGQKTWLRSERDEDRK